LNPGADEIFRPSRLALGPGAKTFLNKAMRT